MLGMSKIRRVWTIRFGTGGLVTADSQAAVGASVPGFEAEPDRTGQTRIFGQRATARSGRALTTRNGSGNMAENEIREALNRHWAASDANDFDVEHDIYREDAVLEYPQSGERIRGRHNIEASRVAQPNSKRFSVRRIIGTGNLWVTEFVLTYDGQPYYTVSIMEFLDGKVARETQYFGEPFEPGPSRAHLVERMG
jgi:hypothetical protein